MEPQTGVHMQKKTDDVSSKDKTDGKESSEEDSQGSLNGYNIEGSDRAIHENVTHRNVNEDPQDNMNRYNIDRSDRVMHENVTHRNVEESVAHESVKNKLGEVDSGCVNQNRRGDGPSDIGNQKSILEPEQLRRSLRSRRIPPHFSDYKVSCTM